MKIIVVSISVLFFTVSCSADCQDAVDYYKPQQCSIIVDEQSSSGRWIDIEGRNVRTGEKERFHKTGGWYSDFKDLIEVGDSVLKRENELMFYIHKKDTILSFPLECQGKIYQ